MVEVAVGATDAAARAYAWRRVRRGWRSGELLILLLALAVAVAAATAVGLFSGRVRLALQQQSGDALGADEILISRNPLPDDLRQRAVAAGLDTATAVSFPSVALHGDATALVTLKAVSANYPLRGSLRIAAEPFAPEKVSKAVPVHGEVWADARLWAALGLKPGAAVQLGNMNFSTGPVLSYEPGQSGGFADLSAQALISDQDLEATGLLMAGSRAEYQLLLQGEPSALARFNDQASLPEGVRAQTPRDARRQISSTLDRSGVFLDLAVLAASLLAAAAVALSARQYGQKLRDEVALLKCLGADHRFVTRGLLWTLLGIGVLAGLSGAVVGLLVQYALIAALGNLLSVDLPAPPLWPLLTSWGLGLVMLLGFALPPVWSAGRTAPLRVLQRATETDGSRWGGMAAVLSGAALLWAQTRDPALAVRVLGGAVLACMVLGGAGWLLVRLLEPLRRSGGTAWRFGLANIARRRNASIAQIVALGLALMALLLLGLVRNDLLQSWRNQLPPQTPNQFLINIQSEQLDALRSFLGAHGQGEAKLWPMARGRLRAINGVPVTEDSFSDPQTRSWINREFNLSWTDRFGDDNKLVQGQWWSAADRGKPWLSIEEYVVERLQVGIGDRLTLQFADQSIELTVHNIRHTEWDSFRPNFFLVSPPGVLDQVPVQWLTSLYVPPQQRQMMVELTRQFPNITVLDLDALMAQVRDIVERVVGAIQMLFVFALVAGLAVLLAAIEGTREERVREVGLLRALGASSAMVLQGLVAEYAVLGLIAGLIAAACAQAVAWTLARTVFHLPFGIRPWIWIEGMVAGAALVSALGWFSLRATLKTAPRIVLAA